MNDYDAEVKSFVPADEFTNELVTFTVVCDLAVDIYIDKECVEEAARKYTCELSPGEYFVEVKSLSPDLYASRVVTLEPEKRQICEFASKEQVPGLEVNNGVPVVISFSEDSTLIANGTDLGNYSGGMSKHAALPLGQNRLEIRSTHFPEVIEYIDLDFTESRQVLVDSNLYSFVQKHMNRVWGHLVDECNTAFSLLMSEYTGNSLDALSEKMSEIVSDSYLPPLLRERALEAKNDIPEIPVLEPEITTGDFESHLFKKKCC